MKFIAIPLSLALAVSALGEEVSVSTSSHSEIVLQPLIITAPPLHKKEIQKLKKVRAAGAVTAAGGMSLMAYVVFIGSGPFGWAAALVFFGGMTAYLSHRKIHGEDDFYPDKSQSLSESPKENPALENDKIDGSRK